MGLAGNGNLDTGCNKTIDSLILGSRFLNREQEQIVVQAVWESFLNWPGGCRQNEIMVQNHDAQAEGRGSKMPKEPKSLGWRQLGLSWLPFCMVTG